MYVRNVNGSGNLVEGKRDCVTEMAAEASFPEPGADCCSTAADAAPVAESGLEENRADPLPTSGAPKKISFSISSILDEDEERSPSSPEQSDCSRVATSETAVPQRSGADDKSEPAPLLTFFYRDQLLSSEKTQSSSGEGGGRGTDALVSSWTMPPVSPFVYREYIWPIVIGNCVGRSFDYTTHAQADLFVGRAMTRRLDKEFLHCDLI